MNLTSLALGLVFLALGLAFRGQAKKEGDESKARNLRFGGGMMAGAGLVMLGVALFSFIEARR